MGCRPKLGTPTITANMVNNTLALKDFNHWLCHFPIVGHTTALFEFPDVCNRQTQEKSWCEVGMASVVVPHGMSMQTFLNLWDDMGMEFHPIPNTFVLALLLPVRRHSMLAILAYAEITSESVASGFALQIVPSKRASGKIIRRFWVVVFSSRAMRLQTSTVLSDFCAFNRSTSSPSNPTQVRMTASCSNKKSSSDFNLRHFLIKRSSWLFEGKIENSF